MRVVLLALVSGCMISEPTSTINPPVTEDETIPCNPDSMCPVNSFCEPELAMCFTDARCVVNGQPSNVICRNAFGPAFGCFEDGPDSFHCVPTKNGPPQQP